MKSFAVIGCGRFGSTVAKTLFELGNEVLAIDINEDIIREISEDVTQAVQADVMDETALVELGIRNFDVVIVSIGSDVEASIMATLIAKELGVEQVIAKAQNLLHGKLLKKIGADKVIYPERDMAARVAHNLTSKHILDYIEISPDYNVLELTALEKWWGKNLAELRLRNKHGINVMAIKRDETIIVAPGSDDVILEGDVVVILGGKDDITKLEQKAGE